MHSSCKGSPRLAATRCEATGNGRQRAMPATVSRRQDTLLQRYVSQAAAMYPYAEGSPTLYSFRNPAYATVAAVPAAAPAPRRQAPRLPQQVFRCPSHDRTTPTTPANLRCPTQPRLQTRRIVDAC